MDRKAGVGDWFKKKPTHQRMEVVITVTSKELAGRVKNRPETAPGALEHMLPKDAIKNALKSKLGHEAESVDVKDWKDSGQGSWDLTVEVSTKNLAAAEKAFDGSAKDLATGWRHDVKTDVKDFDIRVRRGGEGKTGSRRTRPLNFLKIARNILAKDVPSDVTVTATMCDGSGQDVEYSVECSVGAGFDVTRVVRVDTSQEVDPEAFKTVYGKAALLKLKEQAAALASEIAEARAAEALDAARDDAVENRMDARRTASRVRTRALSGSGTGPGRPSRPPRPAPVPPAGG